MKKLDESDDESEIEEETEEEIMRMKNVKRKPTKMMKVITC